ncbi:Alpha,alpha-trehalose-phosphate synthase [UDP-forming] 1 [Vitis vinifera]|uniref:Alpha,alpha-trehalose-phosphate synthase [UDP-forming] 1 n=1 Tax=Vitis vinifera TaxID=29760 RepID=A0A438FGS5_VITVI|nr:Alpha,alpha-trehalose-phosphate synthase [UDP-forming] 1 [Vitis vinifera]
MLGVDRLDMIKGIPQKILAFEKFLEENSEWQQKVVLLQIAVPTRTDVPEYQKLTSQVHEIVGRINGRFGTLTAVPIHHLDRSLDFYALCALYAVTDVALVTSLRDGMNLFAGAAQSLGAGAILVNPWNITEVASSIAQALNMPPEEREKTA